ncbi:MAG: preprotein translocase subunit SecE [Candidatus Omnitrophica bacterium]|nr:preprotein translocase subunit SecE [Candidatus Omnitrophota bacterium]
MIGRIRQFVTEVRTEMGKVTWSSKQELIHSTIIVLAVMFFLSVFIGAVDFVYSHLVKLLLR